MVFLTKTDGYQKMYAINKNVTKMGVIIKGCLLYMCYHSLFRTFNILKYNIIYHKSEKLFNIHVAPWCLPIPTFPFSMEDYFNSLPFKHVACGHLLKDFHVNWPIKVVRKLG